jgi:hypothetical protein
MNGLTAKQRKVIYLAGIIVLLVPIILLGRPGTSKSSGGKLAQLRKEYDLGETTLGNVDPMSATMNLVLLGMRGVAASTLWMQYDEQMSTKNWAEMRATTQSIIKLQPHIMKVWGFHGWNLAYNVSAEWDAVEDRFYWVKEGGKFVIEGTERNQRYPELYWDVGRILGQKIGRADEWEYYRHFFKVDPDTKKWDGGADAELNPNGRDNYLVAKMWYSRANEKDKTTKQHRMASLLFRAYPVRCMFDYATALGREGHFDEVRRNAWQDGFREWTTDYGKERFEATLPPYCLVCLEADDETIDELVRENNSRKGAKFKVTRGDITLWIDKYQKQANYHDWRNRAEAESKEEMLTAHRELFEGEQLYWDSRLPEALAKLESGMKRLDALLQQEKFRSLQEDSDTQEEAIRAVLVWERVQRLLNDGQVPEEYPLKEIRTKYPMIAGDIERRLKRPRFAFGPYGEDK